MAYFGECKARHELTEHELYFWIKLLDELGDDEIARQDRLACMELHHKTDEVDGFGLSALPRVEQARILRSLEMNLSPRRTIDRKAPGAYSLKHDSENYIRYEEGRACYYVSELQAAVCMRMLGYRRSYTGRYNVSMLSYNRMRRRIVAMKRGR